MTVLQLRLSVQPNNIPHELCDRHQWLCWQAALTAAVELLYSDLKARLTILEQRQ